MTGPLREDLHAAQMLRGEDHYLGGEKFVRYSFGYQRDDVNYDVHMFTVASVRGGVGKKDHRGREKRGASKSTLTESCHSRRGDFFSVGGEIVAMWGWREHPEIVVAASSDSSCWRCGDEIFFQPTEIRLPQWSIFSLVMSSSTLDGRWILCRPPEA